MWLGSQSHVAVVWCRLAAAAPIGPLVWELPYVSGAALKKKKKEFTVMVSDSMWQPTFKKLPFAVFQGSVERKPRVSKMPLTDFPLFSNYVFIGG